MVDYVFLPGRDLGAGKLVSFSDLIFQYLCVNLTGINQVRNDRRVTV